MTDMHSSLIGPQTFMMSFIVSNSPLSSYHQGRQLPFNCTVAQSSDAFDDRSSHIYTKFTTKQGW